jgi:hypothetical protein
MNRTQLDHLLRAAGGATGQKTFVLVGSAAVFAWRDSVPQPMTMSREADLFAFGVSEEEASRIADELDAGLGQQSQFDSTFGYYVDGVEPQTAIVPHPDDVALSKLCAGLEKDLDWVRAGCVAGLIDPAVMVQRIDLLPGRSEEQRRRIHRLVEGLPRRTG